jgi:hypothetical protein
MAKSKVEEWLSQDKLILLEGWARDGLTNEQIANNMGINPSTLYDYINKYSKISNALKKGKEVVDFEVENALLKSALEGNVTAQIFWLKNRKPNNWREKVEIKNDTAEEINKNITNIANLLNNPKKNRNEEDV